MKYFQTMPSKHDGAPIIGSGDFLACTWKSANENGVPVEWKSLIFSAIIHF
jgi:hypothetical protein